MSNSVRPHRWQPTRLPCPWDFPGKNTGVGCHFLLQCMKVKSEREVAQSCPTLSDPMDCSPPGSSVHGIFQARVLEWGAIAFSDFSHYSFINAGMKCGKMLCKIFLFYLFIFLVSLNLANREGNGAPLQYSCLENPMDGGAWKAAVHGVAEGQT